MPRYLLLWEAAIDRYPPDPNEKAEINMKLRDMTKRGIDNGQVKAWGCSVDGINGYSIVEGTGTELYAGMRQFYPYITFQAQEILTLEEVEEAEKLEML